MGGISRVSEWYPYVFKTLHVKKAEKEGDICKRGIRKEPKWRDFVTSFNHFFLCVRWYSHKYTLKKWQCIDGVWIKFTVSLHFCWFQKILDIPNYNCATYICMNTSFSFDWGNCDRENRKSHQIARNHVKVAADDNIFEDKTLFNYL